MTQVQPTTNGSVKNGSEELRQQHLAQTPIDHILQKLSCIELPAKEHFERYMRHKWRLNHKPSTLQGSFTSVRLFLEFYGKLGKRDLSDHNLSTAVPRGFNPRVCWGITLHDSRVYSVSPILPSPDPNLTQLPPSIQYHVHFPCFLPRGVRRI